MVSRSIEALRRAIGIPAAKTLRKDELENAIEAFLRTAAFLAADKEATRPAAIAAWTELKELDVPKNYASWVKARAQRKRRRIR